MKNNNETTLAGLGLLLVATGLALALIQKYLGLAIGVVGFAMLVVALRRKNRGKD